MARKKRKTRSTADRRPETTEPGGAESASSGSSPAEPSSAEPKRFRSYFELLEEKYADEEPPQVVVPETERDTSAPPVLDRRHKPRPTRKPKPATDAGDDRSPPAEPTLAKPKPAKSPKTSSDDVVRSATGTITVEPDPPTPRIRQTQAIALDRNMRWVVVLAFLAGVVLTALLVFFLAGDEDDELESVAAKPPPPPVATTEATEPAAPFGSVTEIASESTLPEPVADSSDPPETARSLDGEPLVEPSTEADPPAVDSIAEAGPAVESAADAEPSTDPPGDEADARRTSVEPPPPSAPPARQPADAAATPTPDAATPDRPAARDEGGEPPPVVVPTYKPARKIFAPQPSYPAAARERGDEGTVVLTGRVTAAGDVAEAEIVESAGERLDRVALETFRTWQFEPAVRNGEPVDSPYRVSFRFALDRPPPPSSPPPPRIAPPPPPPPRIPAGTVDDPLPLGGDFEPPEIRVSPLPTMPRARAGEVGDLILRLVVDRDGSVARVTVEQGVDPEVTERAVEAVGRWRFQPATRDGDPVAVWHRLVLRL